MALVWEDLPARKNCFTVRSAALYDLSKNHVVRYYLANTKIQVVQKTTANGVTFYRTETAAHNGLDWAFRASAFGLPDDYAPSAHPKKKIDSLSHSVISLTPKSATSTSVKKQTVNPKAEAPKDGEGNRRIGWLKKLFRRKNG
jgi:hypothetical protein